MKVKVKTATDIAMTILLLLLMAYMLTGQKVHEWMGAAMLVLFLLHNILNYKWYAGLFKGKYNSYRIIHTNVNFLLLASMIGIAVSGTILSQFVVGFLPIHGGMSFARKTHMLCSYWAFLLMSVHLGLHWGIAVGKVEKLIRKTGRTSLWTTTLRLIAIAAACYGAYAFVKNNLLSYMFLKNMFVFFDPDQSLYAFLAEYAAMMEMWACIAYYGAKAVRKISV